MTDITISNNGVDLAASVYGPADAKPILFLHGIGLSRDTWEETAQKLAGRHRVWVLDFRGHGHSDRAPSYELKDYVSDAEAVLSMIAQPTIVVGHSLGGCVAGLLAQTARADIQGVFLEDPPWYLGEPGEWDKSAFPKIFPVVSAWQEKWQQERAPFATYLEFVSNLPSPMGGIASDHFSPRHLWSNASSLQRQDIRCWGNVNGAVGGSALSVIEAGQPFTCPSKIIHADPRFGAALLAGHGARLAETNPTAEIVYYQDCGHRPHAARAFEVRFLNDLEGFLSKAHRL